MGLLLIWIESIAAGLLLVAWILSWTARFRWRITQAAPPVVVAFLLAMPTGTLAGLSAVLVSRGAIQPGTFWYFTTWSMSFGAGLLIVLYWGLKRSRNEASSQDAGSLKGRYADVGMVSLVRVAIVMFVVMAASGFAAFVGPPDVGAITKLTDSVDSRSYYYIVCWSLALGVGLAIMFISVRKPSRAEGSPRACTWPRGRLLIGLMVAIVLTSLTFSNMDLAAQTQLASVRIESGPKVLALIPSRVPDSENAALIYQQAFENLPASSKLAALFSEKQDAWMDPTKPIDTRDRELVEFLRSQEPAMTLLRKGAAMPGCSFERDWFEALSLRIPEEQRMLEGAKLLGLHARFQARQGQTKQAFEDIAAIFGLARHANEPTLAAMFVSGSIDQQGVNCLQDVLNNSQVAVDDLALLTLQNVSYRNALKRSIQIEEAVFGLPFLAAFSMSEDGFTLLGIRKGPYTFVFSSAFYRVFLLPDDMAAYSNYMRRFVSLSGGTYAEVKERWAKIDDEFKSSRGGLFTAWFLPALGNCSRSAAKSDAYHRLAQVALAAAAYRQKQHRLPERLDELTPAFLPAIPLDPFDGQPLRFKRDGNDVVLYSIGPDDVDDGGIPWDEMGKKGDLTFRIKGR